MRKIFMVAAMCCIVFVSTQAKAVELTFSQKIAYDLVKGIASAVIGKEVSKIFGDDHITTQDLDKALHDHFKRFGDSLYAEKVSALKQAVSDFSPVKIDVAKLSEDELDAAMVTSIELKLQSIQAVITATEELAGKIDAVIHEDNFWNVMPSYIYMTNIRLAFLAEKHALDPKGGWDIVLAQKAVEAMEQFNTYWNKHMGRPEGNLECIYKERTQPYFTGINGQSPGDSYLIKTNPLEHLTKIDPLIEVRVCNDTRMSKEIHEHEKMLMDQMKDVMSYQIGKPDSAFFNNKHVFNSKRDTNKWWFVYRKHGSGNQHWIHGPMDDKAKAEETRFRLTYDSYNATLGPVKKIIHHWYQIAYKLGDHRIKMDAMHALKKY